MVFNMEHLEERHKHMTLNVLEVFIFTSHPAMNLYMHLLIDLFIVKVWEGRWRVIPFHVLPEWLKDNDYLLHGHRPPMPSFRACFGSIFRIHTETGNIWTHLLGQNANYVYFV